MGLLRWILVGSGVVWLGSKLGGGKVIGKAIDAAKEEAFARLLPVRSQPFAQDLLAVSAQSGISATILWAIMEWESRSATALTPPNPAGTGDNGHGRGLMQVDDRYHAEWLASNPWWEPRTNIDKGAAILNQKLAFFQATPGSSPVKVSVRLPGETERRNYYIGQGGDYADVRPLSGMALLAAGLAAYNAGEGNTLYALARGWDVDTFTSRYKNTDGANGYSRDIIDSVTTLEQKLGLG